MGGKTIIVKPKIWQGVDELLKSDHKIVIGRLRVGAGSTRLIARERFAEIIKNAGQKTRFNTSLGREEEGQGGRNSV